MAARVERSLLELPWRLALEQGWEAFCAGNPPVGAVITAADDGVVALGRSRFHDPSGPSGQLAGTPLAHSEVNALARLAPGEHAANRLGVMVRLPGGSHQPATAVG
ncbi:hypothetical protein ACIG56_32125 [Nocardia fusca]|uniref:hypothetical protein n=1 Tax=Nocardia fusca TaxID=941183 RepID=UPI0037CA5F99